MKQLSENNLGDIKNYKKKLIMDLGFHAQYIKIISDYLDYAVENLQFKSTNYYLFVLKRGMNAIANIFAIIFMYTKNIELTILHCKKALYYYIEFIGQIADEGHSYLQLNSKDAMLFIYKKTIYEINNEHRKSFSLSEKENQYLEIILKLNKTFNNLFMQILEKYDISSEKRTMIINNAFSKSKKIISKFKNMNIEKLQKVLPIFSFVQNNIFNKDITLENIISILEYFLRKAKKQDIGFDMIKKKFLSSMNPISLRQTPVKYINWLLTN